MALTEKAFTEQALTEQALTEQALTEQALTETALTEQAPTARSAHFRSTLFLSTLYLSTLFLSTPLLAEPPPTRTEAKDTNGDKKPDQWVTYDGTRPVAMTRDRNGDGAPDVWAAYTYPAGASARHGETAVDRDFNGTRDYWRVDRQGVPVREWGDLNSDGRLDTWTFYTADGRKQWVVLDKNHDGRPEAWFYYGEKGEGTPGGLPGLPRPVAGEVDENFDGTPDRVFGTLPKDRPALERSESR